MKSIDRLAEEYADIIPLPWNCTASQYEIIQKRVNEAFKAGYASRSEEVQDLSKWVADLMDERDNLKQQLNDAIDLWKAWKEQFDNLKENENG